MNSDLKYYIEEYALNYVDDYSIDNQYMNEIINAVVDVCNEKYESIDELSKKYIENIIINIFYDTKYRYLNDTLSDIIYGNNLNSFVQSIISSVRISPYELLTELDVSNGWTEICNKVLGHNADSVDELAYAILYHEMSQEDMRFYFINEIADVVSDKIIEMSKSKDL